MASSRYLPPQQALFESLEPRLLLSSDFVIAAMDAWPDPVSRPEEIMLSVDRDDIHPNWASVKWVEFFHDSNGNGELDVGLDERLGVDVTEDHQYQWSWTGSSAPFPAGLNRFFARARSFNGQRSRLASAEVTVLNGLPVIGSLSADPDPVIRPTPILLTANGVHDPDGAVVTVAFYRDADGDGVLNLLADQLLGLDSEQGDGWSLHVDTSALDSGAHTFFALPQDDDGNWGAEVSGASTVVVVGGGAAPEIDSLSAGPDPVTRPAPIVLTANGVTDPDGAVMAVAFYRDADGDGVLNVFADELLGHDVDAAGGWSLQVGTGGFETGTQTFFARANDNEANWSAAVAASVLVENAPPVMSALRAIPNPVVSPNPVVLMAVASDTDGEVAMMEFYYDADGDGLLDPAADTLLGQDADGADGWLQEIDTTDLGIEDHTYFAQPQDDDGAWGAEISTTLSVNNIAPMIGCLKADPDFVFKPDVIGLTASNVTDCNGVVTAVTFYRDADGDGALDAAADLLLGQDLDGADGWTWDVPTDDLRPMEHRFFARAMDDDGAWSPVVSTTAVVDLKPVATFQQADVRVIVYDLWGEIDIDPADVRVRFGKDNSVRSIKLKGRQPMDGLGVLISGATWVGKITDARKGARGEAAFFASDAPIRKLSIKSDLAGWNLNGVRLAGVQFAEDIDSDGDQADPTAVYVGVGQQVGSPGGVPLMGPSGKITVHGLLGGDVVVAGGLKRLEGRQPAAEMDVLIGRASSPRTQAKMKFAGLSDVSIDSRIPVKSIRVNGDFVRSSLALPEDPDPDKPALGRLTVKGWMDESSISALGDVGTVLVGAIRNSSIAAGIANHRDDNGDGVRDLFDPGMDLLAAESSIRRVKVRGLAGEPHSTLNANIMAYDLGRIDLRGVAVGTSQDEPFGVSGYELERFIRREADGTIRWPSKDPQDLEAPVDENFVVRLF